MVILKYNIDNNIENKIIIHLICPVIFIHHCIRFEVFFGTLPALLWELCVSVVHVLSPTSASFCAVQSLPKLITERLYSIETLSWFEVDHMILVRFSAEYTIISVCAGHLWVLRSLWHSIQSKWALTGAEQEEMSQSLPKDKTTAPYHRLPRTASAIVLPSSELITPRCILSCCKILLLLIQAGCLSMFSFHTALNYRSS